MRLPDTFFTYSSDEEFDKLDVEASREYTVDTPTKEAADHNRSIKGANLDGACLVVREVAGFGDGPWYPVYRGGVLAVLGKKAKGKGKDKDKATTHHDEDRLSVARLFEHMEDQPCDGSLGALGMLVRPSKSPLAAPVSKRPDEDLRQRTHEELIPSDVKKSEEDLEIWNELVAKFDGKDGARYDFEGIVRNTTEEAETALVKHLQQQIVEPIEKIRRGEKGIGAVSQRMLISGPPGTGKTETVQAAAAKAGASVLLVEVDDVVSRWKGKEDRAVKLIKRIAIVYQPSIIIIDDSEKLLSKPEAGATGDSDLTGGWKKAMEMAGNDGTKSVSWIAITNYPEKIEAAIKSRLTKKFVLPPPGPRRIASMYVSMLKSLSSKPNPGEEFADGEEGIIQYDFGNVTPACHEHVMDVCKSRKIGLRDLESVLNDATCTLTTELTGERTNRFVATVTDEDMKKQLENLRGLSAEVTAVEVAAVSTFEAASVSTMESAALSDESSKGGGGFKVVPKKPAKGVINKAKKQKTESKEVKGKGALAELQRLFEFDGEMCDLEHRVQGSSYYDRAQGDEMEYLFGDALRDYVELKNCARVLELCSGNDDQRIRSLIQLLEMVAGYDPRSQSNGRTPKTRRGYHHWERLVNRKEAAEEAGVSKLKFSRDFLWGIRIRKPPGAAVESEEDKKSSC